MRIVHILCRTEWPAEDQAVLSGVLAVDLDRDPSEAGGGRSTEGEGRKPMPIESFDELRTKNEELRAVDTPPLLDEEFFGARLYTGPVA